MGKLLSIREVVEQFGKDPLVYTVEFAPKKPPQKVLAKAGGKAQKVSGAKATLQRGQNSEEGRSAPGPASSSSPAANREGNDE